MIAAVSFWNSGLKDGICSRHAGLTGKSLSIGISGTDSSVDARTAGFPIDPSLVTEST